MSHPATMNGMRANANELLASSAHATADTREVLTKSPDPRKGPEMLLPEGWIMKAQTFLQAGAIDPSVTSPLCAAKAARTSSFSRGGTSK